MINNYRLIFVKIRYVITTRLTCLLIVTNKCCHHPPNLDDPTHCCGFLLVGTSTWHHCSLYLYLFIVVGVGLGCFED